MSAAHLWSTKCGAVVEGLVPHQRQPGKVVAITKCALVRRSYSHCGAKPEERMAELRSAGERLGALLAFARRIRR